MAALSLTESLFGNYNVGASRISSLANSTKNTIFVSVIVIIALRQRSIIATPWPLAFSCTWPDVRLMPALTNTMFSIHPPLLYISTALCIFYMCWYSGLRSIIGSIAFFVAMFLGGFWSMQELSWGGWWNWDVLECGIGYIWLIILIFSHKKMCQSLSFRSIAAAIVAITALVYTILNKYGIATSIHSFVSSKSARNHYPVMLLLYFLALISVYSSSLTTALFYLSLLCLSYISLRWCIFIKKPLIMVAVLTILTPIIRRVLIAYVHTSFCYITLLLLLFNLTNYSILLINNNIAKVALSAVTGQLWGFDFNGKSPCRLIWRELFLSKPRYTFNRFLNSSGSRSPSGRSVISGFLK